MDNDLLGFDGRFPFVLRENGLNFNVIYSRIVLFDAKE